MPCIQLVCQSVLQQTHVWINRFSNYYMTSFNHECVHPFFIVSKILDGLYTHFKFVNFFSDVLSFNMLYIIPDSHTKLFIT